MRKESSYNGLNPSVLKSAVQKYIRKNFEKGLWALIELDLFTLIENDNVYAEEQSLKESLSVDTIKMNAKKIRTNMINRLVVIMSEEISINCWWLPIKMKELYEKWMQTRESEISRKYLVKIFMLLIKSEKLRLISDLKTVYNIPPYYLSDYNQLSKLHSQLLNENKINLVDVDLTGLKATEKLKEFENCIQASDEKAFFWLSKLIEKENKDYVNSIWNIVTNNSPVKDVTDCLKFFFTKMTHREKWIYLYHAILLIVHRKSVDFNETIKDEEELSIENIAEYYKKNLENQLIEIDDFVYDIHTGLKADNLKTKFALEGSIVVDENKKFFNKEYRELYIKFKKMMDDNESKTGKKRKLDDDDADIKLESFGYKIKNIDSNQEDELIKLPQAQKRTSIYKKAVYVDQKNIYKGPYDATDIKLLRNLENVKAVLLMEKVFN